MHESVCVCWYMVMVKRIDLINNYVIEFLTRPSLLNSDLGIALFLLPKSCMVHQVFLHEAFRLPLRVPAPLLDHQTLPPLAVRTSTDLLGTALNWCYYCRLVPVTVLVHIVARGYTVYNKHAQAH